jgi:hypothetical protein
MATVIIIISRVMDPPLPPLPLSGPGSTSSSTNNIGGMCPAGGYCPRGSSLPTQCPAGTYNNNSGATSASDCQSCPAGYYCAGSRNPYPTGPCKGGYYCTGGSSSATQYTTPPGYYSIPGSSAGIPCPAGTYQPEQGQGNCTACPEGWYCKNITTTVPRICPRGK